MTKQMHPNTSQRGAIAMYLAIAMGLLLLITTTYAARLQVTELSQSSQVDRSDQAYYAAEAGIEDALRIISKNSAATVQSMFPLQFNGMSGRQEGDMNALIDFSGSPVAYNSASSLQRESNASEIGQLAWRNRKVYDSSASNTGSLVKDETIQYDTSVLARTTPTGIITNSAPPDTDLGAVPDPPIAGSLADHFDGITYCWATVTGSAGIEMTVISWDKSNISDIRTAKVIVPDGAFTLIPGRTISAGAVVMGTLDYKLAIAPYTSCFNFHNIDKNRRFIFRLKPVFGATAGTGGNDQTLNPGGTQNHYSINYRVQFNDTTNNTASPLYIPHGSYLIDVVGQSGDIRRRLVAKKERNGKLINLFDFVLYSGEDGAALCKVGVGATYDPATCLSGSIPN